VLLLEADVLDDELLEELDLLLDEEWLVLLKLVLDDGLVLLELVLDDDALVLLELLLEADVLVEERDDELELLLDETPPTHCGQLNVPLCSPV